MNDRFFSPISRYALLVMALMPLIPVVEATTPGGRFHEIDSRPDYSVAVPRSASTTLSYSQLGDMFWQWQFSLPVHANPIFDNADCKTGPSGPVWFLGGTAFTTQPAPGVNEGLADRTCTLPSNRPIFFPILNTECSTVPGDTPPQFTTDEAGLRACAKFFTDFVLTDPAHLFVTLDGISLTGFIQRASSPAGGFQFGPLPGNNVLAFFGEDAPAGTMAHAVSDGYYLRIDPLPAGLHTLHFRGEEDFPDGSKFIEDITYHLTVTP